MSDNLWVRCGKDIGKIMFEGLAWSGDPIPHDSTPLGLKSPWLHPPATLPHCDPTSSGH